MNKKLIRTIVASALLLLPVITLAAVTIPGEPGSTVPTIEVLINKITNPLWKITVGIAVIFFIYAGIVFITAAGDPAKVSTARNALLWGVAGLAVAILAYSLPIIVKGLI